MAQHTLTKANFTIIKEGLLKESDTTLRTLMSGATKLKEATSLERNRRCSQLSAMLGFHIPIENFNAAMQFVSFTADKILQDRQKNG
jgi:hypothetical protein